MSAPTHLLANWSFRAQLSRPVPSPISHARHGDQRTSAVLFRRHPPCCLTLGLSLALVHWSVALRALLSSSQSWLLSGHHHAQLLTWAPGLNTGPRVYKEGSALPGECYPPALLAPPLETAHVFERVLCFHLCKISTCRRGGGSLQFCHSVKYKVLKQRSYVQTSLLKVRNNMIDKCYSIYIS